MVIVRIWEGLGNQMFQYAYARVLKEKGVDVRLDLDKAYEDAFEKNKAAERRSNGIQNYKISLPAINVEAYGKYSYLQRNTVKDRVLYYMGTHSITKYKFFEEKELKYSVRAAARKGNCYVKGWFQNQRYFSEIGGILRKEFVPRSKIKISGKLRAAMEGRESVAVHIRRGDYVKMQNALNMAYYHKAMECIKGVYKSPVFLVFSDDLEWVKKNLKREGELIFVNEDGALHDYEELFIMSRCNSNIIANSTFSWWAAWLNKNKGKCVIAPKKWFPEQKYMIPESWTLL